MKIRSLLRNNKGTSIVIFTISLVAIMGFASIAVDIGMVVSEKHKLSSATDAAVLAGAQDLVNHRDEAILTAKSYLQKNGLDPETADIKISDDGNGIDIISKKNVKYFFAKILGYDTGEVTAKASAKIMPVSSVNSGVRPFAVENQILNFGQTYILKEGAGDGSSGNYGLLALGGTGADNVRDNILYGYSGTLKVGDLVDTEPGNKKGPVISSVSALIDGCDHFPKCEFDDYSPDCSRVINVIIVDSLDVSGRKPVKIVGFASFFLEDIKDSGGHTHIEGKFIKTIAQGELSETQADYGLRGIKLVN